MRATRVVLPIGTGIVFMGLALLGAEQSAASMAGAASRLIESLSADQRQQLLFEMTADERLRWHFVPGFERHGLTIKAMSEPQRARAHDLLRAGLGQRGYLAATTIMELESVLRALEKSDRRDPEQYWFSVFGKPSATGAWGWRVEGHHLSLHFTIVDGRSVAAVPAFFGANPADVASGPKQGMRALGAQEDAARQLVSTLRAPQRAKAMLATRAPTNILTENRLEIEPLSPAGLLAEEMTAGERQLLMAAVESFASLMAPDIAAERLARVRGGGIAQIGFAWMGETERGKPHYFRIQGPTFLIEYENAQNNGNHVHSVWRDFSGDFGRDLLREHLRAAH